MPYSEAFTLGGMVKEQRRSPRYDIHLPLQLIRVGSNRVDQHAETRNLSANGVLITTDVPLKIGQVVEYHITLPSPPGEKPTPPLRCLGKVVRIHDDGKGNPPYQVAVSLERYEFLRP